MTLPVQTQAVADERGLLTPTWRRWLAELERRVSSSQNGSLASDIAAIATALGSPDGTVANIPEQANADALIVGLDGILTEGRLSNGRVAVRLADLEDTGVGAGLYKITRDDKGRVEGTEAATAADLPYDNTTSGLTATDAQAAIDELAAGSGGGGGATDPSASVYLLRDFYQSIAGSTATGTSFVDAAIVAYTANGGQVTRTSSAGRPAQASLNIATTASSRVRMALTDGLQIVPGGGVIRIGTSINLPVLSNATDRYQITFGLLDRIDGAPANRVYATYADNANSGAWQLQAFNAGVAATAVNGTATPTAGADQRVEIEINAAGTQAELFVNGVSQGVIAISFSAACALMLNIDRLAGNSNVRSVLCNYAFFEQTFSTIR